MLLEYWMRNQEVGIINSKQVKIKCLQGIITKGNTNGQVVISGIEQVVITEIFRI